MSDSKEIKELIEDFSFFESWEDKYQYLIDIGRNVPEKPSHFALDLL